MKIKFTPCSVESCDKVKPSKKVELCDKISAADEGIDKQDIIDDKCDALDDDFDYILSGIDRLCREGNYGQANSIIENLAAALDQAISQISDIFAEE